jgi:MFS family permease
MIRWSALSTIISAGTNTDLLQNWPKWRKVLNFTLVSYYVLWTFVQLDIGFTAWGPLIGEFGFSVDNLNATAAVNYGGLAIGCIFFIPFVHKFGRRPLYLISVVLQCVACVWQARVQNLGDLLGSNVLSGLGGAISETVVQITIADVFFVHEHALMNGFYLLFTAIGAFLGPVASGYVVQSQGWRWMWWWCVIFLGINAVAALFLFEESKYIPAINARRSSSIRPDTLVSGTAPILVRQEDDDSQRKTPSEDIKEAESGVPIKHVHTTVSIDPEIKQRTYWQRMALISPTPGPILQHFWQPIIVLFTFPAVTYTAFTYGSVLAWFAIMTSVQAVYLLEPPYNFTAIGIGLMNLPPFIGAVIGFFLGGWLNDKSILWFAKRNGGIYEPEMRLWMVLPAAIVLPVGILMFGIGLAHVSITTLQFPQTFKS